MAADGMTFRRSKPSFAAKRPDVEAQELGVSDMNV
jgi:hypothetical protein